MEMSDFGRRRHRPARIGASRVQSRKCRGGEKRISQTPRIRPRHARTHHRRTERRGAPYRADRLVPLLSTRNFESGWGVCGYLRVRAREENSIGLRQASLERAYKEHSYRLHEIAVYLGAHYATVNRHLKRSKGSEEEMHDCKT